MRNYILLKEIHKMAYLGTYQTDEADCKYVLEDIVRLVEEERPRIAYSPDEYEHDLTSCGDNPHGD